ncbi:2-aminoethylphosphonate--pyruvate transaminase [Clostridium paraputrificum]|uniref:2-aminoethylphosphonate--pyruvate transaminase n=1 Tax=Clostridium paraputrificum TaxID=29363 RepID=UPI00325C2D5E
MLNLVPDNDYILLTPGPLSTSKRVRAALLKDWCTWDSEYNNMIQDIRSMLLRVARCSEDTYTSVLMQGSGSFSVESVIGTSIGENDKLLIIANGAYGKRMNDIAKVLKIDYKFVETSEKEQYSVEALEEILKKDNEITHVSFVHCETTTGILNPLEDLAKVVKAYNKTLIVDAMSSFGGVKIDVEGLGIDFLISSANKCIQGVPGFGFVIAKKESLMKTKGQAKSLSLDLYDQWNTMEKDNGKWRFTSPTHVTHAFYEALKELEDEGGVDKRYERYNSMQKSLVEGMKRMGFRIYVKEEYHSPIITTFLYPENRTFEFKSFYNFLKTKGFVIYPGKLSDEDTFRIGNIGDITLSDIERLLEAIKEYS